MHLDGHNLFFDAKSLIATNATVIKSNVIDLWDGQAGQGLDNNGNTLVRDLARSKKIEAFIQFLTDLAGASSVVTITFRGGADGDALTGGNLASPTTLCTMPAVSVASGLGVAGYRPPVPRFSTQGYRYVQMEATISGADMTGGSVTAGLVDRFGIDDPPTP